MTTLRPHPLPVPLPALRKPGLFITATDTGVGKTVVTSAIADTLRRQGLRVAVCKPMATGCRQDREGLVAEDAEAIAHFSDCRQPLDIINPVRYVPPLSPAAAARQTGVPVDFTTMARSLGLLDDWGDVLLVEGIGGLMTPIDGDRPQTTVLDLAAALGYPVLVVTRAGLGTLSHTAMTVSLLKLAGLRVAGLVINGHVPDPGSQVEDPSMHSNRLWLENMNRLSVLATLPQCEADRVQPGRGVIPPELLEPIAMVDWQDQLAMARPAR